MLVVMALLLCRTMPAKVNAESRQPCGPDAWYELSEDGTLVISGTGEITKKFGEDESVKYKVKKIVMEEGIEKIGERAFGLLQRKRSRFTTNTEENWGTGILLYPDKNGEYSTVGFRIWERYFYAFGCGNGISA